uniref:NXPE C-terminal domain-containing protein n=1 Tax=Biomphalaria glabrata TaxID=6526 RepID=A0A2C9JPD7_BIOGL
VFDNTEDKLSHFALAIFAARYAASLRLNSVKITMLTCNDFAATSVGPMTQPKNVTLQERDLIHKIPTRHILERTIPHSINVISEEKGQPPKLKPCSLTPFDVTWNLKSPLGFWGPNLNWTSLQCERPELSSPWAMSCLKNTTIMVFGDSNALRIFDVLSDMTNCTGVSYTLWPKAGTCSNNDSGITLSFTPHELPKYQHPYWTPKLDYKGVAEQVYATPSVGKYIIIVHYYLHATPSHLSVVHSRIKSLAESVQLNAVASQQHISGHINDIIKNQLDYAEELFFWS